MTTLVDPPAKNIEYQDDSSEEEDNGELHMAEYDLDVVDEALLNPHNKEFTDHFGFKIQVKTDDEGSSDDDSSDNEERIPDNHTTTTGTSDDDLSSIETNMTSPPRSHHGGEDIKPSYLNHNTANSVPILKSPPKKPTNRASIMSTISSKFKRPLSVAIPPIPPLPSPVSRPSEIFQQRRASRKSILPARSSVLIESFTHYDHTCDSERQTALKQEALQLLKACKERDNNYDWEFWAATFDNLNYILDEKIATLKAHLTKGGIPPSIRGYTWQLISQSRNMDLIKYSELLNRPSTSEKQIEQDLVGNFPKHPYFNAESNRQSLFRVVRAYSVFDQEVGYCRSLAFIVGYLLIHLSEEDTFSVLVQLMGKYELRGYFTPKTETLHQCMYQFDNVLQQKLPIVHRYMEKEGLTPSMYATQWFVNLFSYQSPIQATFRIMDLLFVEGPRVLVQIAIALIIRNQEHILKLRFEALIEFLSTSIFNVYQGHIDNFISDVYRVELPTKLMVRLAQQYLDEAENKDPKIISQEDHLRRVNVQLSEHIRKVEGSLAASRTENNDLTQNIITSKMEIARITGEKEQLSHEYGQIKVAYERQVEDNRKLAEKNVSLVNQLSDTESLLINMKLRFAEKDGEFELLKRQLKNK